ncbi:MAG: RNA methyltransferase [Bacteroidetes bacterium]|nr:RNA methyltransferase [Bacteroidota bacterium]
MESLFEFLQSFLSPERKALFDKLIIERSNHMHVVLEDLYQPHNISAVLRSSDCFGVQNVHIIEKRHQFAIKKKVSLGSSKWLSIHRYNGENATRDCLQSLKSKGIRIVATTPHIRDQYVQDFDISTPFALVFGTEIDGVSQTVMEEADEFIKIPMYGFTESFNISVAAAISLYDLSRRLRESKIAWRLSSEEEHEILMQWTKNSIKGVDGIIKRYQEREGL